MTLYQRYAKKMALGGNANDKDQFGNTSLAVAGIGTGLIDSFDQPNEFGNQSSVSTIGKSALQMGATGAMIGGPVGAAIGGGLGLVTGFLNAGKQRREENDIRARVRNNQLMNDRNMSQARIAGNTSLVQGYKDSQMFAGGGTLPNMQSKPVQPAPSSDPELDRMPDYMYYTKAVQTGNQAAQDQVLSHLQGIAGPETINSLRFMAKNMQNSSINDIAKRSVTLEKDPQMKRFYSMVNENPDIINSLQYSMPQVDLAKKASGGTIEAPLSKAYLQGGQAKSLSSGTTEIEGNSHAEGGVKIPELGAEVESGETTSGNFVFSKELGFAQLHKPIAKAKGIIEKKPQSPERVNAMKLLNAQENKLALSQEYLKKSLSIA